MAEYTPKHKNTEWQNISPSTKTRNGGMHPQTLKHGMAEYIAKHKNMEWQINPKH